MFLCNKCHEESNCRFKFAGLEKLYTSYDRCEVCGKVTECIDCHGYKLRDNHTEKQTIVQKPKLTSTDDMNA